MSFESCNRKFLMRHILSIAISVISAMLLFSSCIKHEKPKSEDDQLETEVELADGHAVCRVIHLMDRPAPVDTLDRYEVQSLLEHYLYSEYSLYQTMSGRSRIVCHCPLPDSVTWSEHPLIDGVRYAYANHHPMVINPDVVWLTIEQGFALHVKYYAEELRHLFVEHEGQKELRIFCEPGLIDSAYEAWEPYFPQFTDSIAAWTKDSIAQTLIADFSTTDMTALVASQIGIMSALQSYFSYVMEEGCGIPDIYLEGTAADWRCICKKANRLRRYGLDWWIDELDPVLQKIAESAEGNVDQDFWRSMYRAMPAITIEEVAELFEVDLDTMTQAQRDEMMEEYFFAGCGFPSAKDKINGWITTFYPYFTYYGDVPEEARVKWNEFTDADINLLACSRSLAPLKYVDLFGNERQLTLHAGLFSFDEDPDTRAIRPIIGWMISELGSDEEQ